MTHWLDTIREKHLAKKARTGDVQQPTRSFLEPPSEEEILRLVAKREQARQARDFVESDKLRDALKSKGVEIYDKEKIWKSKDGRCGVLFTAGPKECTLTTEEIQAWISRREDARMNKDWDLADQLRDEMRSMGVEVDDKTSTWRTGSGRSGTFSSGQQPWTEKSSAATASGGPNHHVRDPLGNTLLERLIAERERLREAKRFAEADEIRTQLSILGVEVYDAERIWRSEDGKSGVIITGGHQGRCLLSEADIAYQIKEREDARAAKDWSQADNIRDRLRQKGVELLDQHKMWVTTDGRQGTFSAALQWQASFIQSTQNAISSVGFGTPAQMSGSAPLSDASILSLIHGREVAREQHNWEAADAIRKDLRMCGVEVWDKDKVWRTDDGRSGMIVKFQ